MSGTSTSVWPDSTQLTRIHNAFPGRHFRYLPGNPRLETGTVDDYYGIIEGDPADPADAAALAAVVREIGALNITLVLGGPDWAPPASR
jgi:hypothetical protein